MWHCDYVIVAFDRAFYLKPSALTLAFTISIVCHINLGIYSLNLPSNFSSYYNVPDDAPVVLSGDSGDELEEEIRALYKKEQESGSGGSEVSSSSTSEGGKYLHNFNRFEIVEEPFSQV